MSGPGKKFFPALRCRMGDWIYYVTCMTFEDVRVRIKSTDEIYQSKRLSEWIQRGLDGRHATDIAEYLRSNDQRFFNALVVGLYDGEPDWFEISIDRGDRDAIAALDESFEVQRAIGVLELSGAEKIFAIDGQHRVAGIKKAVLAKKALRNEEIVVIMVGHDPSDAGRARSRRLFTVLNKTAKRVSTKDTVALDEDDAFAVTARMLAEQHPFLSKRKRVGYPDGAAILPGDKTSLTTVVNLFSVAKDLHPTNGEGELPDKSKAGTVGSDPQVRRAMYDFHAQFWSLLRTHCEEYATLVGSRAKKPGAYRRPQNNHILFRPIGQRAIARAANVLMKRGSSMSECIETLLEETDPWLHNDTWANVLWDPEKGRMETRNLPLAESLLLHQIGEEARTTKAQERLEEHLAG